MKTCTHHLELLKAALNHRGIWHLVALDTEKSRYRLQRWMAGSMRPQDFDPLIGCTIEINKKATEALGNYVLLKSPTGHEYCPLCEVGRRGGEDMPPAWIDNISDLMLLLAKQNELPIRTQ